MSDEECVVSVIIDVANVDRSVARRKYICSFFLSFFLFLFFYKSEEN